MAALLIESVKRSHETGLIKNILREHQWSLRVHSYDTEFLYYSSATSNQPISHLGTWEDNGGLHYSRFSNKSWCCSSKSAVKTESTTERVENDDSENEEMNYESKGKMNWLIIRGCHTWYWFFFMKLYSYQIKGVLRAEKFSSGSWAPLYRPPFCSTKWVALFCVHCPLTLLKIFKGK